MSMLISVPIPIRNAEKAPRVAVNSISHQTHSDLQFIIVGDFSDDITLNIFSAIRDDSLLVINNRYEAGISGAFNTGLQSVKGESVACMNADDRSHKYRLSRHLEYLESHTDIDDCGTVIETSFGDIRIYPEQHDTIMVTLLFENTFAHQATMFRTP